MQKLINTLVLGVAGIFVVAAGFALVQQMVKQFTLQSLAANDISVEQAVLVAQGAIDACKKDNSVISVAVVDHDGLVRFMLRGDGASAQDVDDARKKAYTARTFRSPTSVWMEHTAMDAVENGKRVDLYGQRFLENTIAKKGGMPILWHGDAIGGVGVTGSKGGEERDEACAKAGVEAIADQLL
ncbi:MAG TPA: heme-binding protein [Micropepsaceae bacterium]|nr:heme-binding protein [Micropepsaceae bacterium]